MLGVLATSATTAVGKFERFETVFVDTRPVPVAERWTDDGTAPGEGVRSLPRRYLSWLLGCATLQDPMWRRRCECLEVLCAVGLTACLSGTPPRIETPEARPITCQVTVRIANDSTSILKPSIGGMPASSVVFPSQTDDFLYSYTSDSETRCRQRTIEVTARVVRATDVAGWFVPVISSEQQYFQYHINAPIVRVDRPSDRYVITPMGAMPVSAGSDDVASVLVDAATIADPVELGELEILARRMARLEAEVDELQVQTEAYRRTVRELGRRLAEEQTARLDVMRERDEARRLLAEARQEISRIPQYVQRDIEDGRLTVPTIGWAVQQTGAVLRDQRSEVCKRRLVSGGRLAASLLSVVVPKMGLPGKIGFTVFLWAARNLGSEYVDELAARLCR
jgi:hypothetical protein